MAGDHVYCPESKPRLSSLATTSSTAHSRSSQNSSMQRLSAADASHRHVLQFFFTVSRTE